MLTITKEPPHIARLTSDKVIVKDHFYYKGNDFSWNKAARISSKFYPYYHKQQYENKTRIENMKQQEIEDKKFIEEIRKEKLIVKKISEREIFENRVKEREVMQKMSSQPVATNLFTSPELSEEDRNGMYEIVAKRLNSGKTLRSDEFTWNKLNLASKKNINVYLGKYSVKGEEEMIRKYKNKVDEENQKELEQTNKKSDFHKKTRTLFLTRHEENLAKEELISRPATATATKSSFFNTPRLRSLNGQIPLLNLAATPGLNRNVISPTDPSKDLITSGPFTDIHKRPATSASIDRLALSKHTFKKEFHIDQPDVKGMLVQNMDEKLYFPGNDFYDTLLAQSKVFQGILDENKTSKRNISTQSSNYRNKGSLATSTKTLMSRPATSHSKNNLKSRSDFVIKTSITPGAHKSMETEFDLNTPMEDNEMQSKELMLQDIGLFENKFCKSGKRVGYARVNLEEAYRLTSANGLAALQKIEAKKQQPLVI